MKKKHENAFFPNGKWRKILLIMKLKLFILLCCVQTVNATAFSQEQKLDISFDNELIVNVIDYLQIQTGLQFFYLDKNVSVSDRVSVSMKQATLSEILDKVLKNKGYIYEILEGVVIIKPANPNGVEKKLLKVKGWVHDTKKQPMPGVTVKVVGLSVGTATNDKGWFAIDLPLQKGALEFSFIGYKKKEVQFTEKTDTLRIVLEEDISDLDEVVVTGYANMRKESFTGNVVAIKRDELLKVSKTNVIKALQAFDPSFRIKENSQWGSDPNAMPEVYIRGESGIGIKQLDPDYTTKGNLKNNPNLPTFIMDGFEISVQKLYDFDPNRIESITILKDAAATALYGSRAANGVVVITTVAPKPGKMNVSYSLTGSVVFPDLSDYDLLNATEKLELERIAGCFKPQTNFSKLEGEQEYNDKLKNVEKGIDTYWLSVPLRTIFNHKHSLFVEGGSEAMRFGIDLSYNSNGGVMKGSYRDNIGVALYLDYRVGTLQFRNQVSYNITKSAESPYGDFSKYSQAQPYDVYKDENGVYPETLQNFVNSSDINRVNPLYESSLRSFNKSTNEELNNNLSANWYITPHLQLKGNFGLTKTIRRGNRFLDPLSRLNAEPLSLSQLYSGELTESEGSNFKWDFNAFMAYNRTLDKHNLNFTLGMNTLESSSRSGSTLYKGFPSGVLHSPNYAKEVYEKPSKSEGKSRLFGAFATVNYSFNNIYLFDFSGRLDGSSKFGSDRKYAPFWSTGAGVNIHNYAFMNNYKFIDELKIRGSYGQTGNVSFSDYEAKTIYNLDSGEWYQTGAGAVLSALGNKDLTWETTNTLDVGIELSLLDRLFYIKGSFYNKNTVDCINDVTIPSSTGFMTFKDNVGEVRNRGYDIEVRSDFIRRKDLYVAVYANLNHNQNRLLKISQSLREYNDRVDELFNTAGRFDKSTNTNKPFTQYVEGISMNSLWGVPSLGIDPSSGEEVFLRSDGTTTDVWKTSDQVVLGCKDPDAQGAFGLNLTYKNFSLFANFMYQFGGQTYNQTLVDKVENVNVYTENADKRAFTNRWQKPGDVAKYKKMVPGRTGSPEITRPTSRFVEDYNTLSLSSLSIGYNFTQDWLRKASLSMVRFEVGAEDLCRWSSVKEERGLSYPFARTVNFSLKVSF